MSDVEVRPGRRSDLAETVQIYNHYVTKTQVTFDVEPFSVSARESWFAEFSIDGPHCLFVADLEGAVVGYATSKEFRSKPAYSSSVEVTVYVHPGFKRRGIGRRLYEVLLEGLESQADIHRAYAGIALPNPGSIALHEGLGFRLVGTYREVGRKFGKFWDVSWYERKV